MSFTGIILGSHEWQFDKLENFAITFWKKLPLLPWDAQTGEFIFQKAAHRPTVYTTGVNAVQFGKIFWHTPKTLLFYKENLMTSIFQTPRLLPDFAPLAKEHIGKNS